MHSGVAKWEHLEHVLPLGEGDSVVFHIGVRKIKYYGILRLSLNLVSLNLS